MQDKLNEYNIGASYNQAQRAVFEADPRLQELKQYDLIAYPVYQPAEDTYKLSFIIEKNGGGIQNTDLYRYVHEYGSSFDSSMYTLINYEQMREKEMEGHRNGYDYRFGRELNWFEKGALIPGQHSEDAVEWSKEVGLFNLLVAGLITRATYNAERKILLDQNLKGTGSVDKVRNELLDQVENQKLKNAVNEIYRPGATVGDGGLADAIRHELSIGELVGGVSHIQKATERITNLQNIISKQNLSGSDLGIAEKLLQDLINALGGN